MTVTRITFSHHLNAGKYAALHEQARRLGRAFGRRAGDRLHCTWCGVVWHADVNAAINVLHRHGDRDITLHIPHQRVKQILQERADRRRIRLPIQDSSRTRSAESESSNHAYAQA